MSLSMTYAVATVFTAAVVFVVVKLLQTVINFRKFAGQLNEFPQNPKHPVWGHLLQYPGPNDAGLKYVRDLVESFPRSSLVWLGPFFPMLVVSHPDTVKTVLKRSDPKGARVYDLIRPWVGDGLLLTKGAKWARNRRLLTPAFHFNILKPYLTIKNRAADILLNKIQRYSEKNEYFEICSEISLFTLDIILKCAFSRNTDCQNIGTRHPYVNAVNQLSWLAVDRLFKPWLHNDWVYSLTPNGRQFKKHCDFVHKVAEETIENRRKTLMSCTVEQDVTRSKRCVDFLDILLTAQDENGVGLTPQEIRDETDTFMFAGHDTTASALSWTLYSLAEHPECQETIYREVEELMVSKDNTDIEMEDLNKLPYLTMCIKEAIRLHAPVPVITRETTQDIELDGRRVPQGTMIVILLYAHHHNSVLWPDSMEFKPDRFAPENVEGRDPYAYLPFSAGSRNCIGQNFAMQEIKVALARLLYRFQFELDKNHKVKKKQDAVMRAENGIRMKAKPRI